MKASKAAMKILEVMAEHGDPDIKIMVVGDDGILKALDIDTIQFDYDEILEGPYHSAQFPMCAVIAKQETLE